MKLLGELMEQAARNASCHGDTLFKPWPRWLRITFIAIGSILWWLVCVLIGNGGI